MTASTPDLTTISLPEPNADLVTLICRVCDGEATHADLDRLEQLLTDPTAVTLYLAICELDASLLWKNRWQQPWQPPASGAADHSESAAKTASWLESFTDHLAAVIGAALIGLGRRLASRTGIAVLLAAGIGLGVAGAWRVGLLERPAQWLITRLHQARFPRAPGSIACVTGLHDVVWEAADQAE